jgi:predicted RecA/RadA family phage recombinase
VVLLLSARAPEVRVRKALIVVASLAVVLGGVGVAPAAQASDAGTTWTSQSSIPNNRWRSVTYGNGLFVAVAYSDGPGIVSLVMTSPDGITWTPRSTPNKSWSSVTYGNGLFVAVSDGTDGVMTSTDGITWTPQTITLNKFWGSVTYGNGKFVAVAYSGAGVTDRVMTSVDGVTWTGVSPPFQEWYSVTFGNGVFVAVAGGGFNNNKVMYSSDGITWTALAPPDNRSSASVTYGVVGGSGLFVAVSTSGTGNRVMTSPDGINWTSRISAADNAWQSVTYGDGLFVAVSTSGTGNRVMTSPDGINWTSRASAANNAWYAVTYANGLFVAVSDTGSGNRVMTSGLFTGASPSTLPTDPTAPMQAYGRGVDGKCANNAPIWVNWLGIATEQYNAWGASWQQWPNNGTGGFVCTRQPYFTGATNWSVK